MKAEHNEPTMKLHGPGNGDLLDVPDDPRLTAAVKEYLAEIEAGRTPDRKAILARHPDLADALAQCLDGLDLVHKGSHPPVPPSTPRDEASDPLRSSPLGDFQIVREIGRGGMGVVYEATQLSLGRRVALKVLAFVATFDPKHLQRFRNEAQAASRLHHTNIVPVYYVGCERGVNFYAMQLIDGKTLAELISEMRQKKKPKEMAPTNASADDLAGMIETPTSDWRNSMTSPLKIALTTQRSTDRREYFRAVARLIKQAAEGLEHAHQYGIVHRDIKPANLLVDAGGRLWITDFGLAQFHTDVVLTKTGDILGTLRYMSPEQASGQRVVLDHRTDVYSLGTTTYELATLEPAFLGQDQQELLNQILNEEPRTPRSIDASVPVELETIILKAISKNPADRYASAKEMADDLQRYLDDKPILAKRPGVLERVRKWSRRHPSFVAATLLVLLFGAIGLGISTIVIAQALDREKKRAEEAELRFGLARRSADDMIQLAEVEMADNPALQNLRRQLLEIALIYYQELIEIRGDNPEAQAELAVTRDIVKRVLSDLAVLQGAAHLFLLRHPDVLNDLELQGEDRETVKELVQRLEKHHQESFREFHKLPQEARQKRFVEMALANEAALAEVLSRKQIARLHQIALQAQGPMAFRDPQVVASLKLSADQRKQIRGFESNLFFDKREFEKRDFDKLGPPKGPKKGFDGKGMFEQRMMERRDAVMKQIGEVLTAEQTKKWRDLTGERFDSKMPIFLPGGPMPMIGGFGPPPPDGFGGPKKKDFKDRK
jgi:serine/threonine protein kinase